MVSTHNCRKTTGGEIHTIYWYWVFSLSLRFNWFLHRFFLGVTMTNTNGKRNVQFKNLKNHFLKNPCEFFELSSSCLKCKFGLYTITIADIPKGICKIFWKFRENIPEFTKLSWGFSSCLTWQQISILVRNPCDLYNITYMIGRKKGKKL